jgi:hypothetical protein
VSVDLFVSNDGPSGGCLNLNLSNENFRQLMRLLGFDDVVDSKDGLIGEFSGDRLALLKARAENAQALIRSNSDLDAGTLSTYLPLGGGLVIACGRPAGYYEMRLTQLLALVDDAIAASVPLCYS